MGRKDHILVNMFVKDTSYVLGKKWQNQQLLDIMVDNSANVPKDDLLAELQARMCRSCRFGCFWPHT